MWRGGDFLMGGEEGRSRGGGGGGWCRGGRFVHHVALRPLVLRTGPLKRQWEEREGEKADDEMR
jgi:hypothetical protein